MCVVGRRIKSKILQDDDGIAETGRRRFPYQHATLPWQDQSSPEEGHPTEEFHTVPDMGPIPKQWGKFHKLT